VPAFYSNMGFPLYVTLSPYSFDSGNISAHLRGQLGRGGGIITFVVSKKFPGSVNGGSEGGNFEFMCVGK